MDAHALRANLGSALAVTMMSVPQGVAYALIAGLPPAAGLYAAAVPAILASALRSSSHVVTGPTNAVSLLVGVALGGRALQGADPMQVAVELALLVGLLQLGAGLLRLGAVVDYISRAVVLGYISGAGLLIGFGQLGNLTATPMGRGDPFTRFATWIDGLGATDPRTLALGLGTLAVLVVQRRLRPDWPGAIGVLAGGIALSWALDFQGAGIAVAGDLAPVPAGLPPLTWPAMDLEHLSKLLPVAVAATVLSLVESSAVARSIARDAGERLDMNREFVGMGVGNLGAAFTGAYPVSGSLSRSTLNHRSGATSRWAGMASGAMMIGVLLVLGPLVDLTPIASLAGLLLVVAWDLVDKAAIRKVLTSLWADRLAFLATLIGAWTLPLDIAIYLGVGISVALFLRKVRHVRVTELVVWRRRIRESEDVDPPGRCRKVRALHIEGNLFFGAANELGEALDEVLADREMKVLVLRLKRARGLDYTTAAVLMETRQRMVRSGRHLLLVGMTPETMQLFEEVGLMQAFGTRELYPTQTQWFRAMNRALQHGMDLVEAEEGCHEDCPLVRYLEEKRQRSGRTTGERRLVTEEHLRATS